MTFENEKSLKPRVIYGRSGNFGKISKRIFSAPLATELLEYVPNWTVAKAGKLTEAYTKGKIRAGDICVSVDKSPEFFDKSLSNALAKMVLYLVKEGLLVFN